MQHECARRHVLSSVAASTLQVLQEQKEVEPNQAARKCASIEHHYMIGARTGVVVQFNRYIREAKMQKPNIAEHVQRIQAGYDRGACGDYISAYKHSSTNQL